MSNQRMRGAVFAAGRLTNGDPVTVSMAGAPLPATVAVNPDAAGATVVRVSFSLDGGLNFVTWANGDVTSASAASALSEGLFSGITHARFQRVSGTGTASTWSIC